MIASSGFIHPGDYLPDHLIFIVRFLAFSVVHSLFATRTLKTIICRHEREPDWYRLSYNLLSLFLLMWVMAAYRSAPVLYFAPGYWSLILYALQLVVAVIICDCLRQTGIASFLGIPRPRGQSAPQSRFVTSGWYSLVRHPLYLFSSLFLMLNPVMTAQWLLLTLLSLIYFAIGGSIEERRLLKEFGEEYRLYRRKVPGFIPSWRAVFFKRHRYDQAS